MTIDNTDHYDTLFIRVAGDRYFKTLPLCEVVDGSVINEDNLPDVIEFKTGRKVSKKELIEEVSAALELRVTDLAILPFGCTSTSDVTAFMEKYG